MLAREGSRVAAARVCSGAPRSDPSCRSSFAVAAQRHRLCLGHPWSPHSISPHDLLRYWARYLDLDCDGRFCPAPTTEKIRIDSLSRVGHSIGAVGEFVYRLGPDMPSAWDVMGRPEALCRRPEGDRPDARWFAHIYFHLVYRTALPEALIWLGLYWHWIDWGGPAEAELGLAIPDAATLQHAFLIPLAHGMWDFLHACCAEQQRIMTLVHGEAAASSDAPHRMYSEEALIPLPIAGLDFQAALSDATREASMQQAMRNVEQLFVDRPEALARWLQEELHALITHASTGQVLSDDPLWLRELFVQLFEARVRPKCQMASALDDDVVMSLDCRRFADEWLHHGTRVSDDSDVREFRGDRAAALLLRLFDATVEVPLRFAIDQIHFPPIETFIQSTALGPVPWLESTVLPGRLPGISSKVKRLAPKDVIFTKNFSQMRAQTKRRLQDFAQSVKDALFRQPNFRAECYRVLEDLATKPGEWTEEDKQTAADLMVLYGPLHDLHYGKGKVAESFRCGQATDLAVQQFRAIHAERLRILHARLIGVHAPPDPVSPEATAQHSLVVSRFAQAVDDLKHVAAGMTVGLTRFEFQFEEYAKQWAERLARVPSDVDSEDTRDGSELTVAEVAGELRGLWEHLCNAWRAAKKDPLSTAWLAMLPQAPEPLPAFELGHFRYRSLPFGDEERCSMALVLFLSRHVPPRQLEGFLLRLDMQETAALQAAREEVKDPVYKDRVCHMLSGAHPQERPIVRWLAHVAAAVGNLVIKRPPGVFRVACPDERPLSPFFVGARDQLYSELRIESSEESS